MNYIFNATKRETQQDTDVEVLESTNEPHRIILHNDDVNTFDWVIECLVKICRHTPLQAEQCAMIVHYKGKCDVKSGEMKELKPMCSALLDKGLSAEIV
ncbi:ATP-dependent Clp protease adaptor ClpS [Flavobacteriaceae bacterium Ap0902]|nr:ATP-dependent Clp protease adaptor ClpS [Flavobacteriaceae bacterium Ap0902]